MNDGSADVTDAAAVRPADETQERGIMDSILNEIERRVLGVLMEKEMSQPEYYPMTPNAIVAGCNQKSNRDPVMGLSEGAVLSTLDALRKRGLVVMALAAPGARVNRFKHEAEKCWGWSRRQKAVMTELLLRGPQTVGELRSHCARMFEFESLEAVSAVLDSLVQFDPPMAAALPREPGRAAIRYTHLLYPEGEHPATPSSVASVDTRAGTPASAGATASAQSRLDAIESEVQSLTARLEELARRVEAIERRPM